MKKIVVGFDDTEQSKRALERAADLTEAFGASLTVASVAPVHLSIGRSAGPTDPVDSPERHEEELAAARSYLEGRGISAALQPAVGEPASSIVEIAERDGADLIVVGTHEPKMLEVMLGMSVSQAVSRKAHCDVLIVH